MKSRCSGGKQHVSQTHSRASIPVPPPAAAGHLPAPPSAGQTQRLRPTRVSQHSGWGCTHILSRVPGCSLVPLEAGVAFRALQVTGEPAVNEVQSPGARVRVAGTRPTSAVGWGGPPKAPGHSLSPPFSVLNRNDWGTVYIRCVAFFRRSSSRKRSRGHGRHIPTPGIRFLRRN